MKKNNTLWQHANEVAYYLDGWAQVDPFKDNPNLEHVPQYATIVHQETGASLHIKCDNQCRLDQEVGENSRFEFSANWPHMPHTYPNEWFAPKDRNAYHCTCAASRSPERIARDVERKIVAGYIPAWLEANRRLTERIEYYDRQYKLAVELAGILQTPKARMPTSEQRQAGSYTLHMPHGMYGRVLVRGAEPVELDRFSMPAGLAQEVLSFIMERRTHVSKDVVR